MASRNKADRVLDARRRNARPACSVGQCLQPHNAKGFCGMHYRRWKKTGHPLGLRVRLKEIIPVKCAVCGKAFETSPCLIKRGEGFCCSRSCGAKSAIGLLPKERFWSHVEITGECWLWTHKKTLGGYGRFSLNGKCYMAHRFAWALTCGPIPDELLVLHKCDNPPCVRLDHLFLGTHRDNVLDMLEKKRHANQYYRQENHQQKALR